MGTIDNATDKNSPDPETDPLAPTSVPEAPRPPARPRGEKVLKAMARMGKQRPSGRFNSEEGRYSASHVKAKAAPVMMAPPVESINDGLWAIKGIYEHQGLKIGLRRLDELWAGVDLDKYPTGKGGLLKEKLFRNLFSGEMQIQAIPANDLSAAQPDIQRLSLVQLLRLRVILLDFVPSGGGGLSSGASEAFIRTLDTLLFEKLGQRIGSAGLISSEPSCFAALGREAMMMMDWQVRKIAKEGDLNPEPPRKNGGVAGLVSEEALQSGRARLKSTDNS